MRSMFPEAGHRTSSDPSTGQSKDQAIQAILAKAGRDAWGGISIHSQKAIVTKQQVMTDH